MSRRALLACLLAVALGEAARADLPTGVSLSPPVEPRAGEPLVVSVTVEGLDAQPKEVVLYHRLSGFRTFDAVAFEPAGQGRFTAQVPARNVRGLAVMYFVEVVGPAREWSFRLGSEEQPLQARLVQPQPGTASTTARMAALASCVPLALMATAWYLGRRRRREVMGRVFWARVLLPLTHLRGQHLTKALNELTAQPLAHPVHGVRTYSRPFLQARLDEVREWDHAALELARRRYSVADEGAAAGARLEMPPAAPVEAASSRARPRRARATPSAKPPATSTGAGPATDDSGPLRRSGEAASAADPAVSADSPDRVMPERQALAESMHATILRMLRTEGLAAPAGSPPAGGRNGSETTSSPFDGPGAEDNPSEEDTTRR